MNSIELFFQIIIFALGGWAIGRTIVQETIFEGLVKKIENFTYYPVNSSDLSQDASGRVVQRVGPLDFEIVSDDGYRTDLPRPIAVALGKFGDLVTCVWCASAQATLQLVFWTLVVDYIDFLPFELPSLHYSVSIMFAAVGVSYLINDHINGRLEE